MEIFNTNIIRTILLTLPFSFATFCGSESFVTPGADIALSKEDRGYTQVEDPEGRTCSEGPATPTPYTDQIGLINPTGDAIGGMSGVYSKRVARERATVVVETPTQLKFAVESARAGDVVWLQSGRTFDMSGVQLPVYVPGGVTVAGDRNATSGSKGPLVHLDTFDNVSSRRVFHVRGDKVRITGFRLQGPFYLRNNPRDRGVGIRIGDSAGSAEVDNMEMYGWTLASVLVRNSTQAYVHHSHMHSSNSDIGLAYGVVLDGDSDVLVEANVFNNHRHAVAGSGSPGQSYEARYNIALRDHPNHVFDMHGPEDGDSDSVSAGDQIYIHHNEVRVPTRRSGAVTGVVIRGIPSSCAWITHNRFYDIEERAIAQEVSSYTLTKLDGSEFIDIVDFDNKYGPPQSGG